MRNKTIYADLHVHSTASDGVLRPNELVVKAAKMGLLAFALTDHDTVSGIPEAIKFAKSNNLTVVPGIELSTGWQDQDSSLHVLGLFIDHTSKQLNSLLEKQTKHRYDRALEILSKLEALGFDLDELRFEFAKNQEKVIGRPHIARFLINKNGFGSMQEVFDKYLAANRPAYVPKCKIPVVEAIDTIHAANGLAVIAHPGHVKNWEDTWNRIKDLSWDGIETYYSEHSDQQVAFFETIGKEKNWVLTGGSDFHSEQGTNNRFFGKYGINKEEFDTLLSRVNANLT